MAIALVVGQTATTTDSSNATSRNVVLPNNPTAGNLVIVGCALGNGGASATTFTVKDSVPNSYTPSTSSPFHNTSAGNDVGIWYLSNVPAGATKTITITTVLSSQGDFWAAEFSGAKTSSPQERTQTGTGSSTSINTSITSTNNGDLLCSSAGSASDITANGSPWSNPGFSYPTSVGDGGQYFIQSTAGAQAAAFTAGNAAWCILIAAFEAAPPVIVPPPIRRIIPVIRTRFT